MAKLLQINSSLFSSSGVSSRLADDFVERWQQTSGGQVLRRDLAQQPLEHLDSAFLEALALAEAERDGEQRERVARADRLLAEVHEADVLVIAAPMYNFSVPSQLKAWFDYIARSGDTFRYTEQGPVGLLSGKRAYVFATRGGKHRDSATDTAVPFVQTMLRFIGIEQIEVVYAEGLNMGEQAREQGLREAEAHVHALLTAA